MRVLTPKPEGYVEREQRPRPNGPRPNGGGRPNGGNRGERGGRGNERRNERRRNEE